MNNPAIDDKFRAAIASAPIFDVRCGRQADLSLNADKCESICNVFSETSDDKWQAEKVSKGLANGLGRETNACSASRSNDQG